MKRSLFLLLLPSMAFAGWSGGGEWSNGRDVPPTAASDYHWSTNSATSNLDMDEHSIVNAVDFQGFSSEIDFEEKFIDMAGPRLQFLPDENRVDLNVPLRLSDGEGTLEAGRLHSDSFDGTLAFEERQLNMSDSRLTFNYDDVHGAIAIDGDYPITLIPGFWSTTTDPRIVAHAGDVEVRFENHDFQGVDIYAGDLRAGHGFQVMGDAAFHGLVTVPTLQAENGELIAVNDTAGDPKILLQPGYGGALGLVLEGQEQFLNATESGGFSIDLDRNYSPDNHPFRFRLDGANSGTFIASNKVEALGYNVPGQAGISATNEVIDNVLGPVTWVFVNGIRVQ